jgi:quinol monooxygenase YgiN
MSTLVTNEFFALPGRGDDVASLLIEILGESLQHDGCETIRIVRDQDDPDHVAGVTQWTARKNFDDYLTWRTEQGFTATFEVMLTGPFVIHYYDIAYLAQGIAATRSISTAAKQRAAMKKGERSSDSPPPPVEEAPPCDSVTTVRALE